MEGLSIITVGSSSSEKEEGGMAMPDMNRVSLELTSMELVSFCEAATESRARNKATVRVPGNII